MASLSRTWRTLNPLLEGDKPVAAESMSRAPFGSGHVRLAPRATKSPLPGGNGLVSRARSEGLSNPNLLGSVDSCAGIRTRSDLFVTSGAALPVVHAGPKHQKVVHPCGSQSVTVQSVGSGHIVLNSPPQMLVLGSMFHPRGAPSTGDASGLVLVLVVELPGARRRPGQCRLSIIQSAHDIIRTRFERHSNVGLAREDSEKHELSASSMRGHSSRFA